MGLRPQAKINTFIEVLGDLLSEIAGDRGRFNGPVTAYVGRVYDIRAADAELPALLMQFLEEKVDGAGLQGGSYRHRSWLYFVVWVITANPEAPDFDLHELAADVKRMMLEDSEGRFRQRVGDTGEVIYDGMQTGAQLANVDGKAAIPLQFRVEYTWSHDAP